MHNTYDKGNRCFSILECGTIWRLTISKLSALQVHPWCLWVPNSIADKIAEGKYVEYLWPEIVGTIAANIDRSQVSTQASCLNQRTDSCRTTTVLLTAGCRRSALYPHYLRTSVQDWITSRNVKLNNEILHMPLFCAKCNVKGGKNYLLRI